MKITGRVEGMVAASNHGELTVSGRTCTTIKSQFNNASERGGSVAWKNTGTPRVRSSATHIRRESGFGSPTSATRFPSSVRVMVSEIGSSRASRGLLKRSEEHTSELQSLRHLVCRLLPA